MRLISLVLRNFKGVEFFNFAPDGQSVTVRGTNGAGKSTLYDAYCWLLFGKDSASRADFDILPYGKDDALVSVAAKLDLGADGSITLERTFSRKIVRQKGTDEPSIKSEYKFFVDGVPKTKSAYAAIVESICPTEQLAILSDPDYFAGKLEWKKRRKILGELFGTVSDDELLRAEEWAPLRDALDGRTVEDFRAVAAAERKKIKQALDALPDRINEAELAIPKDAPLPGDVQRLEDIARDLGVLVQQKADLNDSSMMAEYRRQIAEKKAEISEKRAAYYADYSARTKDARSKADMMKKSVVAKESQIAELEQKQTSIAYYISLSEKKLTALREEYSRINALVWDTGRGICPACGQALPPDRIDELRSAFNSDRSKKLEENIAQGRDERNNLDRLKGDAELTDRQMETEKRKLDELRQAADEADKTVIKPVPFEETEDYRQLSAELGMIEAHHISKHGETDVQLLGLDEEIKILEAERDEIHSRRAAAETAARQRARIDELRAHGREIGKRAAQLDNLLDMAARFEQFRLTAIEKIVSARFMYADFKLFDRQINGGYSECCEVVVDDAPYSTNLNPGKKINAGLDIIRTLSGAYGFSAPVWVDNAESYVHLMDTDDQIIRLQVDASAEDLTVQEG